jgi:hypothetical protein
MSHAVAVVAASLVSGCAGASPTHGPLSFEQPGVLASVRSTAHPQADCPASPGGSGILKDGDFSQSADPGNDKGVRAGTVFAPSWIVTKRTIDFEGTNPYWVAPYGVCTVDLDGSPGAGGIKHGLFSTRRGATYTLTFLLSGNGAGPPAVKIMTVKAGKNQFTQFTWDTSNGNDAQNGDFAVETWQFRADRASTTLTFQSEDPKKGSFGPIVAAIAVSRLR